MKIATRNGRYRDFLYCDKRVLLVTILPLTLSCEFK